MAPNVPIRNTCNSKPHTSASLRKEHTQPRLFERTKGQAENDTAIRNAEYSLL